MEVLLPALTFVRRLEFRHCALLLWCPCHCFTCQNVNKSNSNTSFLQQCCSILLSFLCDCIKHGSLTVSRSWNFCIRFWLHLTPKKWVPLLKYCTSTNLNHLIVISRQKSLTGIFVIWIWLLLMSSLHCIHYGLWLSNSIRHKQQPV